jgi:precorrin-2 dehydrogenase / sirohydrochlorin ferrochelatase
MLPLMLDLARLKLILIGDGPAAERRLAILDAAGAADLTVYAKDPSLALAHAATGRLVGRLPSVQEIVAARLVFIAAAESSECHDLAATARAAGVLVHVEDEPTLSDCHAPATLRRGELLIAVSTGGRSPSLAVQVKGFLATLFGPEWQGRLDKLAALRRSWREGGADAETVAARSEDWVGRQGWLPAYAATSDEPNRIASA